MFTRTLDITPTLEAKSAFLFGPRQTGKSTLLANRLPEALFISLLRADDFRQLSAAPERLREWIGGHRFPKKKPKLVVVDEIQKLPSLLDEVHSLIESDKSLRFVLTGSSARKLRRSGTNLLGGRARRLALHPITSQEFTSDAGKRDALDTLLQWGGLPSVLGSKSPKEDLEDYIGGYLKEEIQAEAIVRSIESFSRFLNTAALSNTEQVIFSAVGSDAEVPARTVREFFGILEDTLVGTLLPAYRGTSSRKAMAAAKFYLFDVGVANALQGRFALRAGTPEYGKALEHLIWRELTSALSYLSLDSTLYYWRSLSQFEVDFVLEHRGERSPFLAIEVKGKRVISAKDCKGLVALAEDFPKIRKVVVSLEPRRRKTESGVEILPVREFLDELWAGEWLR
jgi:predicted AAA+ superfamily ATPase